MCRNDSKAKERNLDKKTALEDDHLVTDLISNNLCNKSSAANVHFIYGKSIYDEDKFQKSLQRPPGSEMYDISVSEKKFDIFITLIHNAVLQWAPRESVLSGMTNQKSIFQMTIS